MEACEVLYRFFRTASEYIEGYRSDAPYPESFAFVGDSTAAAVTTSAAAYPAGADNEQSGIGTAMVAWITNRARAYPQPPTHL